jgi:hypothetical protein
VRAKLGFGHQDNSAQTSYPLEPGVQFFVNLLGELGLTSDQMARIALLVLVALMCVATWQKWGRISVDAGREMYIPAALRDGKRLYIDIWYNYGPLVPYWHAFLFRLFGIHLSVLYAVGISIVTTICFTLYSASRFFLPVSLSCTAVFAFILQAFQLNLFNYVLPYSYPASYGSMFAVVLLWLLVSDCFEPKAWRVFAAGSLAAMMLLTKLEFGVCAYLLVAGALAVRAMRAGSIRWLARDAALCLPGIGVVIVVYGSLIARTSLQFLFGDGNFGVLPGSFFASTYGAMWARRNGSIASPAGTIMTILTGLGGAGALVGGICLAVRSRKARIMLFVLALALSGAHLLASFGIKAWHTTSLVARLRLVPMLFFNPGMVWVTIALFCVTLRSWWRNGKTAPDSALLVLTALATAIGSRVWMNVRPEAYSIFYDTAVYLAWLVAIYKACEYLPERLSGRMWQAVSIVLCSGVLACTAMNYPLHRRPFKVASDRGSFRTMRSTGQAYAQVLSFLEGAKSRSESFVILPEDTALYYLSASYAPSRWYVLIPPVLPPSEQASYIADLERAHLKYVLLSNRATPEYGKPIFGIDYNQEIYRWIQQNFELKTRIGSPERVWYPAEWGVEIYERKALR